MRSVRTLCLVSLLALGCSSEAADSVGSTESTPDQGEPDTSVADAGADATTDASVQADADAEFAPRSIFERGPYNVGFRKWKHNYDAVLDPGREIKLVVWYPTTDTEGTTAQYITTFRREGILADASVAIDDQAPVMVFSHGNSAVAEQSYFLTEWFASHGWIVIAPYHTGNTVVDAGGGITFESAALRPQDITATLDALYALPSDDPLAGKASDDVLMTGHSFGAFTTLSVTGAEFAVDEVVAECETTVHQVCGILDLPGAEPLFRAGFLDERIDVAVPMAPGVHLAWGDGLAAIDIPTMVMTARLDRTLPGEADLIWGEMRGDHMRVDFTGGGHFTFSNMCELLPVGPVLNDGCGEEFIPYEDAFPVINAYTMAWARYVLWGDEEGLDLLRGVDERFLTAVDLSYAADSTIAP